MKHSPNLINRHCEEGAARRGNPSRRKMDCFATLAMTFFIILIANPAFASCPYVAFDNVLKHADVVVEASFLEYDLVPVEANGRAWNVATKNFTVKKNWNGSKKNQVFKVALGFGANSKEDIPRIVKERKISLKNEGDGPFLFLLRHKEAERPSGPDSEEIFGDCNAIFPITFMNKLKIFAKYPTRIFQ